MSSVSLETPRTPGNGAPAREPWENGPPEGFGVDTGTDVPHVASKDTEDEPPPRVPIAVLDGPAIAGPLPELEYLVREIGLVAGGGAPHLLAGYGFSGKTVAAQSLALALAAGRAVWGAYPVAPRRVLHVDFEQGERLTRRRYQRLALAMGVDLTELGDALSLAVMPRLALILGDADRWRELMTGRDLVIIDSLRAATGGQDENSSEIRAGLDMLGIMSNDTACRPLVIHHGRKQGQDDPGGRYSIRGSSAIYDASDSVYLFSAEKGEAVSVEHVKARTHGEPVENSALVISDVEHAGDPKAGLRVHIHGAELLVEQRRAREAAAKATQERADAEAVRRAIGKTPGIGSVDLRGAVGFSGARVAAALKNLGETLEVREHKEGRTRTMQHYLRGR